MIEKQREAVTADQNFYWFKCPLCGDIGCIDADQVWGLISIECQQPDCTFHDTGTVEPRVSCDEPMDSDRCPTWPNYHG